MVDTRDPTLSKQPDPKDPRLAAKYAAELIPMLAIWGLSRDTARRVASAMATTIATLTDEQFERMRQGLHVKPGAPHIEPANDESGS